MTQVFRFPIARGCGHAGAGDKAAQSAWARLAAQPHRQRRPPHITPRLARMMMMMMMMITPIDDESSHANAITVVPATSTRSRNGQPTSATPIH